LSNLLQLTGHQFLDQLASSQPAPGGGSASAQAVATAAALLEMVSNLTIGRKKYGEVQAEMEGLREKANSFGQRARALVDEDTQAYDAVVTAFQLPKSTDSEKALRNAGILEATRNAIRIPQETANLGIQVLHAVQVALSKGNPNAFSDGLVAAYLASAGCKGAIANIKINLNGLKDDREIEQYIHYSTATLLECDVLLQKAEIRAKAHLG
jgi:formiminotetrahydrofolate cyclodeaminase